MIRVGLTAKAFLLAGLLGLASERASAEPSVTYVGLGRYSCSGTAAECAQINLNNSQVEEANRCRYQEDQDPAQHYVDENHRKELGYQRDRKLRRE